MTLQDDSFRYYQRSTVLIQLFSLLENLFLEVAKDMAEMLRQPFQLPPSRCQTSISTFTTLNMNVGFD